MTNATKLHFRTTTVCTVVRDQTPWPGLTRSQTLDTTAQMGSLCMAELQHKFVITNGIRLHYVEQGAGPLVLLCHGFPESWYSWRHQLGAVANAGFHVVAPDMRG